ncbi:MAG: signal peptidase II [Ruminococcus sp.]|nr:signal peptidase II [Ruminococcus sp.]
MFWLSMALACLLVGADQFLKYAVNEFIDLGEIIEVIKIGGVKIFSLTHIRNKGAAWSMMEGKKWFLVALPVAVVLVGMIYMFAIRKRKYNKFEMVSLSMIIAGGVGNLIDRVRMGEVIDYILFEPVNFPIFNFADICIVIGSILFCIAIIIADSKKAKDDKRKAERAKARAEAKKNAEADSDEAEADGEA